jgi:hypothetical protein
MKESLVVINYLGYNKNLGKRKRFNSKDRHKDPALLPAVIYRT